VSHEAHTLGVGAMAAMMAALVMPALAQGGATGDCCGPPGRTHKGYAINGPIGHGSETPILHLFQS
jgi:hypothetical protein